MGRYPAYNKPASIIHWLNNYNVTAEIIIVLDADMILRNPFTAELVGATRGHPIAAHYGYLVGIFPENAMSVKAKVDNWRKAQQVGGFVVMHVDDLRKVAPLWLSFTEEVRTDSGNWAHTGDIFNGDGARGPPWISEMYVYPRAGAALGNLTRSQRMTPPAAWMVKRARAAVDKLRIGRLGFGTARQKMALNEGQISRFRGVRVALGTGYHRVEGNRRASRNGGVSSISHPKPLTLRFATFASLCAPLMMRRRGLHGGATLCMRQVRVL